jgi:Protein of Unknown function (DUF2784)
MGYRILADLIAALHLGYVSFVVVGELLILFGILFRWSWIRNFWFRVAHLVMILVVALESFANIQCPLTVWEVDLRKLAGQATTDQTFIERLVEDIMFCNWIDYNSWIFTASYVGFAALVLLTFWIAPPRWPWKREPVRTPPQQGV